MKAQLTFLVILVHLYAFCQDCRTHAWSNTFEFSPSFNSNYSTQKVPTAYSGTMKTNHGLINGSIGFSFVRNEKSNLHLETGIYLVRRGFSSYGEELNTYLGAGYTWYSDTIRSWSREFEHFFRVPVGINCTLPFEKSNLFIGAGLALDLTLFREKSVGESSTETYSYSGLGTGQSKRSNDFFIGGGVYLKFGYSLQLGERYSLSLSSFYTNDLSKFTGHTYSTGITVGLKRNFLIENTLDNPPKTEKNTRAKNVIYIEGLGSGVIWSLNYERRLHAGRIFDLDARIGFSHSPRISTIPWLFPVSLSGSFGKSVNKFEILFGYGTMLSENKLSAETINTHFGYRLDSNNLVFFRAAFGGLYFLQGGGFVPDAAIAIGKRF